MPDYERESEAPMSDIPEPPAPEPPCDHRCQMAGLGVCGNRGAGNCVCRCRRELVNGEWIMPDE